MPTVVLEIRNSNGEVVGERRVQENDDTWLPSTASYVTVKSVEDTIGDPVP